MSYFIRNQAKRRYDDYTKPCYLPCAASRRGTTKDWFVFAKINTTLSCRHCTSSLPMLPPVRYERFLVLIFIQRRQWQLSRRARIHRYYDKR